MSLSYVRSLRSFSLAIATALSFAAAGCGLGTVAGPSGSTIQAVSGLVHGGQAAIQGSTVTLYHTDPTATTYGAAGIAIGSAVVTDANGNFTLTTSATSSNCPAGTQAYITAAGGYQVGQASSTANTQMLLVAALGDCSTISASTRVILNEVTTVAAAYALSGFTTTTVSGGLPVANISAPIANSSSTANITATTPAGLAHAFMNATNLVNNYGGMPNATVTASANGGSITGVIPYAEILTLADAMQACVDSTSSTATPSTSCTTLFTATPSISGTIATNTYQAFVNLARNPSSPASLNATTGLYSLVSASSAFQTYLAAAPTDWAVAVVWGKGTFPTPYWNTLDAADTFYMGTSTVTAGTTPAAYAISAYGTTTPAFAALPVGTTTRGIAADALGNLWIDNNSSGLYQYSATAGTVLNSYTTLGSAYGLAIDRANNIWIGHVIAGTTNVDEFAYTPNVGWASNYTAYAGGGVYGLAVDANQNIWPAQYYTSTTGGVTTGVNTQAVMIPNTGTAAVPAYTPTTTGGTTLTPLLATFNGSASKPYYAVFDASGNAWYSITGSNSTTTTGLEEVPPNALTGATALTPGTFLPATTANTASTTLTLGTLAPQLPAIDGAGVIFAPDNSTNIGLHMFATGAASGSQALSITTGIKGCYLATAASTTCGSGSSAALYNPRQFQVDSTGSVWTGITNGGATQVIGIAAPAFPLLQAGKPGLSPGLTAASTLP